MRKWLANKLALLASRLHPQSEEVKAFYEQRLMDMVISGNSFIKVERVAPEDVVIERGVDGTKFHVRSQTSPKT